MKTIWRIVKLASGLSLVAVLTGCEVTLQHNQLTGQPANPRAMETPRARGSGSPKFAETSAAPAPAVAREPAPTDIPAKGTLALAAAADEMPERIGSGTFTVFAIPIAPVHAAPDSDQKLMSQFADAMEYAGYKVVPTPARAETNGPPVLHCLVQEMHFKNYTYFFPLVFNWGHIDLRLLLVGPDGKAMWYHTYSAHGNGMYSFEDTVSRALTDLLNQTVRDIKYTNITAPGGTICPQLKTTTSVNALQDLLTDLRLINDPVLVPEILPLLHHPDDHVVRDACLTLGKMGDSTIIPQLEFLLKDKRSKVRHDAQSAIDLLHRKPPR